MREEFRNGERVLRYAQADRMLEPCVARHNSYPGSPRTDWREGDVRGALEIVLPVSQWQLASTTVLLIVLLCCLLLIWLSVRRIRLALATSHRLSAERAGANRHLRLSESKLHGIFASVPDAIVVADHEGRIVQCNPAVARVFGHEVNDLLGQKVDILMDAEQQVQHKLHMQRYLASARPSFGCAGLARSGAGAAGAHQFDRQRDQVHRAGGGAGACCGGGCAGRGRLGVHHHHRHRHRHRL